MAAPDINDDISTAQEGAREAEQKRILARDIKTRERELAMTSNTALQRVNNESAPLRPVARPASGGLQAPGSLQPPGGMQTPGGMDVFQMGRVFAESGFFSDARDEAKAIVKILAGQELGISPFTAMTSIHVIQGKPTVSAGLMAQAVKASGKYDYRVLEHSDAACEIAFFENGQEVGRERFTAEDAQRAGTQNMNKFPRNMLFARCISNGVKFYCPDVFKSSVYTPEELGAEVDAEGNMIAPVVAPTPQRTPVQSAPVLATPEQWEHYAELAAQCVALGLKAPTPFDETTTVGRAQNWIEKARKAIEEQRKLDSESNEGPVPAQPAQAAAEREQPAAQPVYDASVNGPNPEAYQQHLAQQAQLEEGETPKHFKRLFAALSKAGLDSNNGDAMRAAINKFFEGSRFAPIQSRAELTPIMVDIMLPAIESGKLKW